MAFSDADREAREYIIGLMRQEGLEVRIDAIGNITARLEGSDMAAPAVITGSHLDTVPEGGKYDGMVGVVGGLEAIIRLKQRGPLRHPVELIIFVAEESSRFGFGTMGSKAMAGMANVSLWSKAKDQNGISFSEALADQGFELKHTQDVIRTKESIKAFIELHIEQGPVLEKTGNIIGIVEAIAAPTRLKIKVEGIPAHSGTTPMGDRHDALVSAAMIVLAVQETALEQAHRGTVGTVGALKVQPGVMNVIPGLVEMGVDIRGVDYESIIETLQELKDAISAIADDQETPVSIEVLTSDKPVQLDREVIETIEDACQTLGISCQRMSSGAGHDAMNMAYLAPAGMIFIPCREGISHNPEEYADPDHIMAGIEVLAEALYQLAK